MATNATAQFWLRPADGAAANGGGYDPGISGAGTNGCDSATPLASWTSSLTLASGTLTDAGAGGLFTAQMIGHLVNVASQGYYWITARTDGNNVTVVAATLTTATSFSGASGKVGGAGQYPKELAVGFNSKSPLVAGNQVNVRCGSTGNDDPSTPDINLTYTDFSSGPNGTASAPIRWVGYNGRAFYKTTVDTALFSLNGHVFENWKFMMTASAVGSPMVHGSGVGVALTNCILDQNGVDQVLTNALDVHDCCFRNSGSTAAGTLPGLTISGVSGVSASTFSGLRGPAISVNGGGSANVEHCVIANGKADAITFAATQTTRSRVRFNTIDGHAAGAGVKVADASGCFYVAVTNNVITSNLVGLQSGAADAATTGRAMRVKWDSNNLFGNTTARTNVPAGANDTATNPTYTASGSLNYGLGASLPALPTTYRGTATATNLTVGAAQAAAGGGGGGGTYTDPGIANVRSGTGYTYNSVSLTGTLTVPSLADTKIGVAGDGGPGTYNGSDRWTDPGIANVRLATAYKANSTTNNRTGNVTIPATGDVRSGTTYDTLLSATGTLVVSGGSYTAASNVRLGTDRGDGTTGTLAVPATNKVLAGESVDATTGTLTLPTAAQVLVSVAFGVGGTGSIGTVTLPDVGDVRSGTTYGASLGQTGTLVVSGGGTDWTSAERAQIRYRLGLDGTQTAPTTPSAQWINGLPLAASDGTAQAGSTSSITLAASASSVTDFYKKYRVYGVANSGVGQWAFVTAYNGTTKVASLDRTLAVAFDSSTQYTLDPPAGANVEEMADGTITSAKFAVGTVNAAATGILERLVLLVGRWFPAAGGSVTAPKSGNGNLVVKTTGGATISTQAVADDGTTQTLGAAS